MTATIKQRCNKCLLPDTYPDIVFDNDGVCNQCNQYEKSELLGENALIEILKAKHGKEFDCVVGISGGKDSCYVTYLAKKKYGLRTLAVCYDFPFLRDLARANIQNVCNSLGVELHVIKSKNNLEQKLLRNHLISLSSTGTSWGQCIFCHYGIDAILYNFANERGIPFILGGITKYELWNPGSRTAFLAKRLRKLPIGKLLQFFNYQSRAYFRLVDQRRQFRMPPSNCLDVYRRAEKPADGPQSIHVFDYVQWDQGVIEQTLMSETGWIKPDKTLSWRYDCSLEPFLDYTYKKEFGISTVGIYLSQLIRDGKMDRQEAMKMMEESENDILLKIKLTEVFDELNIPSKIKDEFFAAP